MEDYYKLFEAEEGYPRHPSIIKEEIAELSRKIESAKRSIADGGNRIAGYKLDTDPKHANTIENRIRAAEAEMRKTEIRIAGYEARIAALEEERRAWFRAKAEKDLAKAVSKGEEGDPAPKQTVLSYSDIVSFLLGKHASISFESASDKVGTLKWLLPDLKDDQINVVDVNRLTSGGYKMKFGISGYIRVSDLEGLPAGYANYFNGNAITEISKVIAIVRSNFDALSPLILKHENASDDGETVESLTEGKDDKFVCCICGEECTGYGNNPEPYKHEGRCCDACNLHFVIPARLAALKNDEE